MKKILFLGNSHVGALKAGFRLVTSEDEDNICTDFCKVNFAGFPGRLLDQFHLKSNLVLAPKKRQYFENVAHDLELDGNKKRIQLDKFDLIAIVQGPSPFYPFLYFGDNESASILSSSLIESICTSLWTSDHNSRSSGKWNELDRFTYISPCIVDILKCQKLNTVYIGTPVPSKDCLTNMHRNSLHPNKFNLEKWGTTFNLIRSICYDINSRDSEFSSKVYLPCSEVIDKSHFYTSNHFFDSAKNAIGRDRRGASDGWHANANYGSIVVSDFLKKVFTFYPGK